MTLSVESMELESGDCSGLTLRDSTVALVLHDEQAALMATEVQQLARIVSGLAR